jgi:hypothetical protein
MTKQIFWRKISKLDFVIVYILNKIEIVLFKVPLRGI